MCGIVGIAGSLFAREELTMKRLLLLDSLRGMDSTGMATVRMGGKKVEIAKRASHCFNLFDTKSFNDILNGTSSLAFIGHNRSATSGAIKDVNAHPFQVDHITGVHNGTLEDSDKRVLEDMVGEKFNVDSEALFAAIAKFGVKEVIPKLQKGKDSYKGAWSLVWWDTDNKTLNFLRNDHRPLWYCYSDDFKLIFWASEFWMLDAALQRAGTYTLYKKQSEKHPEKSFRFFQTEVDIHYTVDVEKLAKGSKDRPKITAAKLAGKEPVEVKTPTYPFVVDRSKPHGTVCGSSTNVTTLMQQSKKNKTTLKTISLSGEPSAITLLGDIHNPYAGYFDKQKFYFLGSYSTGSGGPCCSWCHERIPYGQAGLTIFTRDNIIHCAKCSGNETVSLISDVAPATRIYVPRAAFNELR
jgi:predicted glutamine amidotransferase